MVQFIHLETREPPSKQKSYNGRQLLQLSLPTRVLGICFVETSSRFCRKSLAACLPWENISREEFSTKYVIGLRIGVEWRKALGLTRAPLSSKPQALGLVYPSAVMQQFDLPTRCTLSPHTCWGLRLATLVYVSLCSEGHAGIV
ncbi:hypothetical protein RRG08_011703 [Elysia crispata]|uniref:Uncharacterized protein n=1 Tax=Elysia crispata TaxID=231223 RepID=A0AAE1BE13_9GAST|nr:hypothetical protein RRG08_011703 [Elysia crispata]